MDNKQNVWYRQSSGSQSKVWMLKSMVLLALVTSVQWTPPDFPPVKHCRFIKNNVSTEPPAWTKHRPPGPDFTQMSHESTVPNMARWDSTASRTSSTLSMSQRSFTALKYVLIGSPVLCCGRNMEASNANIQKEALTHGEAAVGPPTFRWFLFRPGVLLMRRSTVDCVRRSNQTEQKRHNEQTAADKQEVQDRTDGVVEGLAGLLVPNKGGLSLVRHSDRWANSSNREL